MLQRFFCIIFLFKFHSNRKHRTLPLNPSHWRHKCNGSLWELYSYPSHVNRRICVVTRHVSDLWIISKKIASSSEYRRVRVQFYENLQIIKGCLISITQDGLIWDEKEPGLMLKSLVHFTLCTVAMPLSHSSAFVYRLHVYVHNSHLYSKLYYWNFTEFYLFLVDFPTSMLFWDATKACFPFGTCFNKDTSAY